MGAGVMRNQLIKSFAILLLCASCTGTPVNRSWDIHDLALGDNIITLDSGDIINIQKDWGIGIVDEEWGTESFVFCEIYLNDKAVAFDKQDSIIQTEYDYSKKCEVRNVLFEYAPEFLLVIVHRDANDNCAIKKINRYRIIDYKFIKI